MNHKNFTSQELINMENEIESFFKANSMNRTVPVDTIAIAKSLGFKVYSLDLNEIGDNIDGIILVDEKNNGLFKKVIAFNQNIKNVSKVKFIIAHELAHYISQKSINEQDSPLVFAEKLNIHGEEKSKEEQEMDFKAAAILIPKDKLSADLQDRNYNDLSENDKQITESELADIYGVEIPVIQRRIEEI